MASPMPRRSTTFASDRRRRPSQLEHGATTVEFAAVAVAFMLILFAAVEMSRLLFTWNVLDAITQRAARLAVVCPRGSAQVVAAAMFQGADGGAAGLVPGLSAANIQIDYLGPTFANASDGPEFSYATARIVDYELQLAIPFINDSLVPSPAFATTLPAESTGFVPETGRPACFA